MVPVAIANLKTSPNSKRWHSRWFNTLVMVLQLTESHLREYDLRS